MTEHDILNPVKKVKHAISISSNPSPNTIYPPAHGPNKKNKYQSMVSKGASY